MILTLTVRCVWGAYLNGDCVRVIEIDDEATLFDLHNAIQDAVAFDRDHPFSFFVANSFTGVKRWLSDQENWDDVVDDFLATRLTDVFPLGRKKLHYVFDFGDDWTFEIRKARKVTTPVPGVKYPRVVASEGDNPEQYPDI
jgi:hypothetical protein